jgi:3-methyladenine DNA glycosylase AlkD
MTPLDRLDATLRAHADPEAAVAMRAYMRDQFEFLGLKAPAQRALARQALAGTTFTEDELRAFVFACWERPEREFQYVACDQLRRSARTLSPGFLDTVRTLIVTRSWWDTVDALAAHVVGPLVARHGELLSTMDEWIDDDNLWLIRTAILHQLRYSDATDAHRLFRYCTRQASHPDFFIRKAIGWALREYARTAPDAVRSYVRAHETRLSSLSIREATRHLG